jgi:DNA-binding NarL/FixJ family response regulator
LSARIRVVVADDHAVVRAGLRLLINAEADMEVVAEASDGPEAVKRAREAAPDVLLYDLTMPRTDGLGTVAQVVASRPEVRVLVLTMHDDPAYVHAALAAGASGYLVKKADAPTLVSAIRAIAGGRVYVDATVRTTLPASGSARGRGARARARLSPREGQVLRLLGQGHTNREIAQRLRIGRKSVETYRARLSEKLQLSGRADLVRYALHTGILSPESVAGADPRRSNRG